MCPPSDATGARAFTLLELLIALSLLSLVLTLVYGAFGQISTGATRRTEELIEHQEMRLLLRMIADDLSAVQWLERFSQRNDHPRTGIVGGTIFDAGKEFSDLSFHTARPARFYRQRPPEEDPGLHEVGYFTRIADDGQRELVRREDYYLDDELTQGGLEVVLARGVEDFLVEFLPAGARPTSTGEDPWENRWDAPSRQENDRMPVALRLTLSRKDSTGRVLREVMEINLSGSIRQ